MTSQGVLQYFSFTYKRFTQENLRVIPEDYVLYGAKIGFHTMEQILQSRSHKKKCNIPNKMRSILFYTIVDQYMKFVPFNSIISMTNLEWSVCACVRVRLVYLM